MPGTRGGQGGLMQRRAKNRNEICALPVQSVFDTEPTVNSLQRWVASACMTFDIVHDIVYDIVDDIQAFSIS